MSDVTVIYDRSLGLAPCLAPGEWTERTATGLPAVACHACGAVFELTQAISEDGYAGRITCECGERTWIKLGNFADQVVT